MGIRIFLLLLTILYFLPSDSLPSRTPNVTVDNSKNNKNTKIQEAIDNAPSHGKYRYVIYIKEGIYNENITVWKERPNITLVGDGKNRTIISSNLSNKTGHTIQEATIIIHGSGFLAMDLTVRNVAGAENGTAVAVLSNSPYSAFYHVSIEGYQDTLYIREGPQLFTECDVYGTVDFIFGEGPAVLQNCKIFARQSPKEKENAIAANGCFYNKNANCGFSFHRCQIHGDTDLLRSSAPTPTYLGRAWKNGSKTIFMESSISSVVNRAGWLEWPHKHYEKMVYFAEFNNTGKGASVRNRVDWPGVVRSLAKKKARKYTVEEFLKGKEWLPKLNVPYIPNLF
ncbi:Plant invertase/pectin methylesterase inhibitor superfamily [Euphorbia peplus]|nr:Plant invertase/pectin methylesterase inhibitor superfamily [Euphorbia peplus]